MALSIAKATVVSRSLTARFDYARQAATPWYPSVCSIIPSDGADEEYGQIGDMPGMREWLGDRLFKELRSATYVLKNKEWESSLLIPKINIDDDRLGLYPAILEQLAVEAAYHPDELVMDLINNGHTTAGWDGQFFFDTDHAWGDSGTQDNDLQYDVADTGGNFLATATEAKAAFHAARVAMVNFKNDQGKYLNRTTLTSMSNLRVLCAPEQEQAFREGLETTTWGPANQGGNQNLVLDRPMIEVSPLLAETKTWYLFNMGAPLRPFIFQTREALSRGVKGADDMETKDLKFMTYARYNAGYGAWWTAVRTEFT